MEGKGNIERLTKYSNDLIRNKAVNILRKLDSENGLDGYELALISSFCLIERVENKELKKYEDLEEQGKLLKRAVEVGTLVYEPYQFMGDGTWEIDVHKIRLEDLDKIGKSVFLTREEAEAALKELERGKGND